MLLKSGELVTFRNFFAENRLLIRGGPALFCALWLCEAPALAVDFGRDIQPILAKRCYSCHGPDKDKGGLRLNDRKAALAELDSGERAIVPGKPDDSALVVRVESTDPGERMPPTGKPLSKEEITLLKKWIADGAEWQQHWAFRAPQPQSPPRVKNEAWVRNPIDNFILAKLEEHNLQPALPAEKAALLRRAYYDLTGLPPSLAEVDAFLADSSPDAFEKVVDRLLASERYGEHWARHWLDLVRYADTNSFERDGVKPNAWRYRDYVIRSFNADKPYNQFIREQLAGDEFSTRTDDNIIATGYYRLGLWDDEPADPLQARYDELDDIVTTTSQVLLGLTVNCARCHDHKIDPIPQTDYYKLLAFFHEVPSYGTRGDQLTANQTDISPPGVAAQHARLDREKGELREQMAPIEQRGIVKMSAEDQRRSETREREKLLKEKLREHLSEDDWNTYSGMKVKYDALQATPVPPRTMALSVAHCLPRPPQTFVFSRGNPHVPAQQVEPGFPAVLESPAATIPAKPDDAKTSGRRTVLANWIASPDNRMTARVMVNRIWQHHFGRGIVRSTNNFGQLGDPPTHPELLDWLAAEFVSPASQEASAPGESAWTLKRLHKLIMLSSAYRMSSRTETTALQIDPANNLFWRFDMRRLSAEEIRDSIHAVTGQLNLKMYGHGFYPEISKEVLAGQSQPGAGWGKSSTEEQARRSVYIHVKRSLITPVLAAFDFPETDSSCEARFATTQPAQALAMLNSDLMHRQAAVFAERLRKEAGSDVTAQIKLALNLSLCRPPDQPNIDRGLKLIDALKTKHSVTADAALQYYCLMVLNLNEFLYLD